MGLPVLGAGNSFLARMLTSLSQSKKVGAPETEFRTPIDVLTLGAALLELAGGTFHGIFHLAGLTKVSRFELNRAIASRFGFPLELIFSQSPAAGRAPRPRDVCLDVTKARNALKTPLLTLNEGLSLIIENRHSAGVSFT
jgi:dTDP-4-dehydrorhamnose reductase